MSEALHYPIYITTPDKIDITKEQFDNLSIFGLGSFLISWPFVIDVLENGDYQVYGNESKLWKFNTLLNKQIDVWSYQSVEMLRFDIPKDHKLIARLDKYCSHLKFMK